MGNIYITMQKVSS